ncbi:MAG: TlpA disulfide reductase family protein [Nitrospirota bacterium]
MKNIFIAILLVPLLLSITSCSKQTGVIVGQGALDFRLKTLKGYELSLSSLRGKVVLINFWATWCGPCKKEMPSMETLYRSYKREDFEILAISIDTAGAQSVRDFVGQFGFTFPILLDTDFSVNQTYEARYVPTSVLVDRNGIIREHINGARDWMDPEIRLIINKLVKGKTI